MSRAKVPLNIENTPLDLTSSFSCLCAAWMYVANRTNSEIGLWQMGAEILGGSATLTLPGLWRGSVIRAAIRHDDRAALAYVCDIRDEARQNSRADEKGSGFSSGFSFDSNPLFTLVSKKS